MSSASIKKLCSRCIGSGVDDNVGESVECEPCEGEGYRASYLIDTTDIMKALSDIMDKCNDIFEKVSE